jgi:hypothetical protein
MSISRFWFERQVAAIVVLILLAPFAQAGVPPAAQTLSFQQSQSSPPSANPPLDSNNQAGTPGVETHKVEAVYPESPVPAQLQATNWNGQNPASQSNTQADRSSDQKPVGTAAAPLEKATGVTASRPAGAVIAPAKQRRARSILIRVGVVVGAAVAVGTVVGLSRGSSSRPN